MTKQVLLILFGISIMVTENTVKGQSTDIVGPAGSGQFGYAVKVVANGNYVVADPYYDEGAIVDVGAVYLYNGSTHTLISILKGSNTNDRIGLQITLLTNGNFVVQSHTWNGNRGAVTWINGTNGLSGTVSSSNSFTGNNTNDNVGIYLTALTNGNYVIVSPFCSNGAIAQAGAVTLGNGTTGTTGIVSSSNSLVGSMANDIVGYTGLGPRVYALDNGNYVVCSSGWNGSRGAVTWGNGTTGVTGIVSSSNSLVGSTANDRVGYYGIVKLTNGSYVVCTSFWDNGVITDAGAVTWCSGTTGITGSINSSNSLVGSKANDWVGYGALQGYNYVIPLSNGNYVVGSPYWHNGAAAQVGAATWGDGNTGITGTISSTNSLIGNAANDFGAYHGITALTNGNYVVCSEFGGKGAATFCNGTTGTTGTVTISNSLYGAISSDAVGSTVVALTNGNYVVGSGWSGKGAATWGNGTTGIIGTVSSSNSLVGGAVGHGVAAFITALTNGNYVVSSPEWDNGATLNVGAATWGNGSTGTTGVVSTANSLVGTASNNYVANGGVTALKNGNYVVKSYLWDNGALTDVGAATWGNGSTGTIGNVSSSNSLIGSTANDHVAINIITLSNGNYILRSSQWDNGAAVDAGAISWGNGNTGIAGIISNTNSLVGTATNDAIGNSGIIPEFDNKFYLLNSPSWDNGAIVNPGAATFGSTITGVTGYITSCNSIIASNAFSSTNWGADYDPAYDYFVIGRRDYNLITIYRPSGMELALHLDYSSSNLNGMGYAPIIANGGCRIISTLNASGASPITGALNSRIWVESTVPVYSAMPFVARHYEIYPVTNGATATGKVTLYFTQQEFIDFNNHALSQLDLPSGPSDVAGIANLRIGKYPGISGDGSGFPGTYSNPAEVINPADADIIWNNSLSRWEVSFDVTGFGGFVVQTQTGLYPLPVKLVSFTGILDQSNRALLTWKVENQSGTKEYIVEKSDNGRNFQAISTVTANGNTDFSYHFLDPQSLPDTRFYRIQIVGEINTSNSNTIRLSVANKTDVNIYPMPATDAFIIQSTDKSLLGSTARLVDAKGSLIKQFFISNLPMRVYIHELGRGLYMLQLHNGNNYKIIKE